MTRRHRPVAVHTPLFTLYSRSIHALFTLHQRSIICGSIICSSTICGSIVCGSISYLHLVSPLYSHCLNGTGQWQLPAWYVRVPRWRATRRGRARAVSALTKQSSASIQDTPAAATVPALQVKSKNKNTYAVSALTKQSFASIQDTPAAHTAPALQVKKQKASASMKR